MTDDDPLTVHDHVSAPSVSYTHLDVYKRQVKLYQWDDKDPILKAWQKVFPGTVTPMSQMSADLIAHMRYPEDLFNVQRTMMATYHVNDAAEFYSGGDFWKIPDDPTTPGQDRCV